MAQDKGCHTGQLALAWLWKQGEKLGVDVVPIPGTTKIRNVQSNCSAVDVPISDVELAELSSAFDDVVGERGFEQYMSSTYKVTTNAKEKPQRGLVSVERRYQSITQREGSDPTPSPRKK
ncbi:MAG: hypothetical protein CM1200mP9_02040 [Gammaproteobacteria bacterium]|nr:MAG: hypothetical protein CM1200mP9_02040 [Gammaproteobacteria bacterium]